MKLSNVFFATVICLLATQALGAKRAVELTAENLPQEGFVISATRTPDGLIAVTLTRELAKSRTFDPASELQIVRSTNLEIRDGEGIIARSSLEPQTNETTITYHFQLAPRYLAESRVVISEIDDYKKSLNREHLIGGGTIFTLQLRDVVKP